MAMPLWKPAILFISFLLGVTANESRYEREVAAFCAALNHEKGNSLVMNCIDQAVKDSWINDAVDNCKGTGEDLETFLKLKCLDFDELYSFDECLSKTMYDTFESNAITQQELYDEANVKIKAFHRCMKEAKRGADVLIPDSDEEEK